MNEKNINKVHINFMPPGLKFYAAFIKFCRGKLPAFLVLTLAIALCCWLFMPQIADAAAWALKATHWSDRDEAVYSDFVARLGESDHGNFNRFIRDANKNPLYGDEDRKFNLSPDCADFPYLVRAYVAYKLRLPFGYVCEITKKSGGDERYSFGNRPKCFKDQDSFNSPQSLFSYLPLVNSGYYRMAPTVEDGDTYPVRISPESIRPGTIYYDPNGHVALVYKVTGDGRIRLIDAHPDRSISRPWFGGKFERGSAAQGGGFRKWRPLWYGSDGKIYRAKNHNISDYSADDQYHKLYNFKDMQGLSYFDYVRAQLSSRGGHIRPLEDFRAMMEDIHEDMRYRAIAVDLCLDAGVHHKPHPGVLPWNIYGTDGEWETYSTPSRDARLKTAAQEFFNQTLRMLQMAAAKDQALEYEGPPAQLAADLLNIYDSLSPTLTVTYTNSAGQAVKLTFHQIMERMFDLSFDPYHAPEYRWGASGKELETAPKNAEKNRMYVLERTLRNQLERLYNVPTPLSMGPQHPPDVDVRKLLVAIAGGGSPNANVVAATAQLNEIRAAASTDTTAAKGIVVTNEASETSENTKMTDKLKMEPKPQYAALSDDGRALWKLADAVLNGAESAVSGAVGAVNAALPMKAANIK